MTSQQEFWLILGMTAVTFGVRYPVLALVGRFELPHRLMEAMRFIPPAVLTAIIAPALLMPGGSVDFDYTNAYLAAGIIAGLTSWRTKNLLLTIVVGMIAFLAWRVLIGAAG
ncbi:MAG: AzlD domain-containing protein [Caldilineaceae bacterium]|nr:AzlD domain-containing protein [Caldilineaceae bacterium]